MKKRFKDYLIFSATMTVAVMMTSGVFAGENSKSNDVKKAKIQLPDNINELSAMEAELSIKSRKISDQLFKVLTDMRMEKSKVTKSDPEIKALNAEISNLRAKVAKLTLEKSKDMSQWAKMRETLATQHDDLRKELLAVKEKKIELLKKSKTDK